LETANSKLSPGISPEIASDSAKRLGPLVKDMPFYLAGAPARYQHFDAEKLKEEAFETGLPVTWIYLGLENGLFVNYPATGSLEADYDHRTRPWYKEAMLYDGAVWSSPYIDAFGFGVVISAAKRLYAEDGSTLGVAGLDITFANTLKLMGQGSDKSHAVLRRYLLDQDGDIILSTNLREEQIKKAEGNADIVKFDKFPYPRIGLEIKKSDAGQFEVEKDGRTMLVCYAPVRTFRMFYVEEILLERLLDHKQNENRD
jgi:hypothetical protein